MHEIIHERGEYFDQSTELAKHREICNWAGQGHNTMAIIKKNWEDEQKRREEGSQ
jgi:hypothetical protein